MKPVQDYLGTLKIEISEDGTHIVKITIGNYIILNGVGSILEQYNGKVVRLTVEA